VRREITAFLERSMGNGYFGFKDPRTVRLMPMWHQIVNELKLAPKIVFCLRNPAQVARSLNVRDGFSLDTGEYRWFSYTVDFFTLHEIGRDLHDRIRILVRRSGLPPEEIAQFPRFAE
jgi:hypothetical protein